MVAMQEIRKVLIGVMETLLFVFIIYFYLEMVTYKRKTKEMFGKEPSCRKGLSLNIYEFCYLNRYCYMFLKLIFLCDW